jgi:hypothetical protein
MFTVKTILAVGNTALLRHWRIRLLTLYIKSIRDDLLVLNTDQGVPSAFRRDFWRLRNVEISVIISLLFAYRDFALCTETSRATEFRRSDCTRVSVWGIPM